MKIILKILKGLWTALSVFRSIVFNLIFLIILVIIFGAMQSQPGRPTVIPDGAALIVAPIGQLVDSRSSPDLTSALTGSVSGQTAVRPLINSIRQAAGDEYIKALVLDLNNFGGGGFSKLREVGTALAEFRESGKRIYALGDNYTQGQYYLAAFADEIILNPLGAVDIEGFSSYQPYLKEALDKLSIDIHIFRVGEYKAAVEPYERSDMSDEARANSLEWLNDLWQIYLTDIQGQRELDDAVMDQYVNALDQLLIGKDGDSAALALEVGLVDRVADRTAAAQYLKEKLGLYRDTNTFAQITVDNYRFIKEGPLQQMDASAPGPKVGVIMASGEITDGKGASGEIGGDTLAALIRTAREDDDVHALVLHIDSPGGSAFASEIIRSELLHFKTSGKPLIVSMGSTAASGGYWIAAPADEIWANAATITGSIGIFSILPTFDRALENLGVYVDGVGTTELSGALQVGRPLPEVASRAVQQILENGYDRFLNVVAEGRGMTPAEVDVIARGRVWSGQRAQELGLVDELGDFDDAVADAAERAGLSDYDTRVIAPPVPAFQKFLQDITNGMQESTMLSGLLPSQSGTLVTLLKKSSQPVQSLLSIKDPRSLYVHCMECVLE